MTIQRITAVCGMITGAAAVAALSWAAWSFALDQMGYAKAADVERVVNAIDRLDAEQTGLAIDFYQREYNRLQVQVWEMQQSAAPRPILQPFISERDRAGEILDRAKTKALKRTGVLLP